MNTPAAIAAHLRQRAEAEAERARALGVLQTEAEDGYTILEGQRPGLRAARRSIAFAAAAEVVEENDMKQALAAEGTS